MLTLSPSVAALLLKDAAVDRMVRLSCFTPGFNESFSRASPAYRLDGSVVAAGVPRFEVSGVTVEEGTVNLLTANQAGLTTDMTGLNVYSGCTISRETGPQYRVVGGAALKVVTNNGAASEGVWTLPSVSVSPSVAYTASVWLCGSGTVQLSIIDRDSSDAAIGMAISGVITLTATPTRYSVAKTMASNAAYARLRVFTDVQQAATFYASGLQIEQKTYATSWIGGGSTRAPEVLTVPTVSVLSPGQGTVEMLVNVAANTIEASGAHFIFGNYNGTDVNRFTLGHTSSGNIWYIKTGDGSGNTSTSSISDSGINPGVHRVSVRWSASDLCIFVDGVKGTPAASPKLLASFFSTVVIGSMGNGSNFADAQISEVVISSRPRTDAEMAARGVLSPLAYDKDTTFMSSYPVPRAARFSTSYVVLSESAAGGFMVSTYRARDVLLPAGQALYACSECAVLVTAEVMGVI